MSSSLNKPAIAQRLEAESAVLAAKKASLTQEKIADDMAQADDRRARVLEERVETAKKLECGKSRECSPKRQQAERQ